MHVWLGAICRKDKSKLNQSHSITHQRDHTASTTLHKKALRTMAGCETREGAHFKNPKLRRNSKLLRVICVFGLESEIVMLEKPRCKNNDAEKSLTCFCNLRAQKARCTSMLAIAYWGLPSQNVAAYKHHTGIRQFANNCISVTSSSDFVPRTKGKA